MSDSSAEQMERMAAILQMISTTRKSCVLQEVAFAKDTVTTYEEAVKMRDIPRKRAPGQTVKYPSRVPDT